MSMATMFAAVWFAHRRERRAAGSSADEISQTRTSPSSRRQAAILCSSDNATRPTAAFRAAGDQSVSLAI
jgi:hypothetical protein